MLTCGDPAATDESRRIPNGCSIGREGIGHDVNTSDNSNQEDATETDKEQEEATLATYQKMAAFTALKKTEAKRSIG